MDSILQQPDFKVIANQKEIPVLRVTATFVDERIQEDGSCYGIAVIDSDEPVSVEIRCERDLSSAKILPEKNGAVTEIRSDKVLLQLTKHGSYVIEPQSYKDTPLILFYNPVEKNAPSPDTPGVHYYGPGLHSPGKIELNEGETLYLASGAVVEAYLWAQGDNITICGHGVLTQRTMPRCTVRHCLDFYKCNHLTLRDFITMDPCAWNLVLRDCCDVSIDNVKICGGRMLNDDGIDVCNSSNVTIRNCFVRAQDDIIAVKGLMDKTDLTKQNKETNKNHFEHDNRGIRNVLVEKCLFWCDYANVFRIGYECIGETMADITVRDCDIVHLCDNFRPKEAYWANAVWHIQASHKMPICNLLFEDLRIYVDIPNTLIMKIVPMECPPWIGLGNIHNCTFRNISFTGASDTFHGDILIAGKDSEHTVENIHIENVTINGKRLERDSENIYIGDYTKDITIS